MCRTPPYPASRKQLPAEVLTLLAAAACHSNPCHCCWRRTVHIPVRCATALLRHLQAAQQQVVKTAVHTCSTHTPTASPTQPEPLHIAAASHTPPKHAQSRTPWQRCGMLTWLLLVAPNSGGVSSTCCVPCPRPAAALLSAAGVAGPAAAAVEAAPLTSLNTSALGLWARPPTAPGWCLPGSKPLPQLLLPPLWAAGPAAVAAAASPAIRVSI